MLACPILSRVTSGRAPVRSIRLQCIVRKLRKSISLGKPSFTAVTLICRLSRLCRSMGLPARLAKTKSSGVVHQNSPASALEGVLSRFSIVVQPESMRDVVCERESERGHTFNSEELIPRKDLLGFSLLRNCPMLRPRSDGAGRPVWERSKSGFPMQHRSPLADSLGCLWPAPNASGPRGSSGRTQPSVVSSASRSR